MRVDWFSSVRGDGGDGEAHILLFSFLCFFARARCVPRVLFSRRAVSMGACALLAARARGFLCGVVSW